MELSINTRQAYSEVDEFLGLLTEEERNKIPRKLRDFFKEERDINYNKNIDPNIPIKEQNLKQETLAIIALLMIQYWYKDESKKQILLEILDENEREYQEKLIKKYNPSNIFENKSKIQKYKNETKMHTVQNETVTMIEYKESILKKIWNRILFFVNKYLEK